MNRRQNISLFIIWLLIGSALNQIVYAENPGGLTISEFLTNNKEGIEDEDSDNSDWIEIRNNSTVANSLEGFYLTDDPLNLTKWAFPETSLGAGETLLVFASDKNNIDPAGTLHTNFRLSSSAGGYLALVQPNGTTVACVFANYPEQFEDVSYGHQSREAASEFLVVEGDHARYLIPSEEVSNWNSLSFDDSAWAQSTTGIGYSSSSSLLAPYMGSGTDEVQAAMEDVNASAYIRIPFQVSNAVEVGDFVLSMRWDDGFVAYLNGEEIHRENAPDNPSWNSSFIERVPHRRVTHFESTLHQYSLENGSVVEGENILAIHGLNSSAGSSDFLISPHLSARRIREVPNQVGFFPTPTPGEDNITLRHDEVLFRPSFSVTRGTYEGTFPLALTTTNLASDIYYTLDGSEPSVENGILYEGPLSIAQTTVVRAVTHKNARLSDIETHTFFFPAATNIPSSLADSLLTLPVISLNSSSDDFSYREDPLSVELLNFEAGDLQLDAGGERFGQYFTNFSKRGIRLHFRSRYGAKRLRYPLFAHTTFPIAPVDSFDSLDLRAGNHDRVQRGAYVANRYTDNALMEMGHLAPHGRFVHVFFNGEYIGQYHLRERWSAAMLADYLPGDEEEYDTINANNTGSQFLTGLSQNGDLDEWNELQTQLAGPTPFASSQELLDIPNLIDFMLLWTMGGAESEFRAGGSSSNGVGFRFFIKDADGFLRAGRTYSTTHNGPLDAMTELRSEADPDFMTLLGDRIHKHFFNDGALTTARNSARLEDLIEAMKGSYPAELARWPSDISTHRSLRDWESYLNNYLHGSLRHLSDERVSLYRQSNMYPDLAAPVFEQHGGFVAGGNVSISVPSSVNKIYFRTGTADTDLSIYVNSLDPRLPGGAVSSLAQMVEFPTSNGSQAVTLTLDENSWLLARSFNEITGEWSALNEAFFSVDAEPANAANLVVSKIHYHPADPSTAEASIANDADEFEFLELMNVDTETIDLAGVSISGGITFTFGEDNLLAPGARVILTENEEAFEFRYASLLSNIVLGRNAEGDSQYGGKLSNGGENLILSAADGNPIQNFTYQDESPWPTAADGSGYALVLKNPGLPIPDHNRGTNWAASAELGGLPGGASTFGFLGDSSADEDGDGLSALLEYALASDDSIPGDNPVQAGIQELSESLTNESFLTITYNLNQHAQNVVALIPQISIDLITWETFPNLVLVSNTDNQDGSSTLVYRSPFPVGQTSEKKEFIRVIAVE